MSRGAKLTDWVFRPGLRKVNVTLAADGTIKSGLLEFPAGTIVFRLDELAGVDVDGRVLDAGGLRSLAVARAAEADRLRELAWMLEPAELAGGAETNR